jgi:hypothetical protein
LSCAGVSGARFECADDDDVGASEGEGGDRSALISADISMSVTKEIHRGGSPRSGPSLRLNGERMGRESEATFGKGRHVVWLWI